MKNKEFENLKIGQLVYLKNGFGGQVSEINRTTKRISGIGIGNKIFWRFLHMEPLRGSTMGGICGICGKYEVVEKMVPITNTSNNV